MAKWLIPSKSGQIYRNAAGRVYTGTAGTPVFFEDADAAGALIDGWSYSPNSLLEPEGKLIPTPIDNVGTVVGLVADGITDDGPAIRAFITAYATSLNGKRGKVVFPLGASIFLNSSVVGDTVKAAINCPANISIDFNGCTLTCGTYFNTGGSGYILNVIPAVGYSVSYLAFASVYENAYFVGSSITQDGLLYCGASTDGGAARVTYRRIRFSSGYQNVNYAANAYLHTFDKCDFVAWSNAGIFVGGSPVNSGENIVLRECVFYNAASSVSGNAAGIQCSVGGFEFHCFGCSFDYIPRAIYLNGSTANFPTKVLMYGCHLESYVNANFYSAGQYFVQIANTGTASQVLMIGGTVSFPTVGGGTALAGVFSSGVTGAAAPFGIVLNYVTTYLNGVTLNNAAQTGRFLNNT